jgi:DNA-binding NarL/FixJ family response regulator
MMELDQWHEECRTRIAANLARFGMSPRESEVCWLLFTMWTGSGIAEELGIAEQTVKNTMMNISEKLDLPVSRAYRVPVVLCLLDIEGLSE